MGLIRVLKVYPNGDGGGADNSLSLYLLSESNEKNYVRATLRVLNQIGSDNVEKQGEWFSTFFHISDHLKRGKNLYFDIELQNKYHYKSIYQD